ncbi:MAG: hypothetical protein HRF49_08905 [bacterium]|jgi:hypothetical protein
MESTSVSQDFQSFTFLWSRYQALQHHLHRTYSYPGAEHEVDRRHEEFLRGLIEQKRFADAAQYIESMTEFCDSINDSAAALRYRGYKRRLEEFVASD